MCDACEEMIAEAERIEARNAEIKRINELLGIIGK
jgi:hypothetical protein